MKSIINNWHKYHAGTLILFLLFTLSHFSASASSGCAVADSLYKAGDYTAAVNAYEQVIDSLGTSADIYYNLGNAYARAGDYGKAMVAYLRSLRIDPSYKKSQDNARYIEAKVLETNRSELRGKKYALDQDDPSFFSTLRLFFARDHTSDTWAWWAAGAFLLFVTCAALYIFSRNVLARKIGFFGGFICLGISVITLIFSIMAASYKSEDGVIIAPKVQLLSEPSVSSKPVGVNLTRGTVMTVLDTFPADSESPKWYKIRLNSDFVGWIQASDFETVGI